jgi:large subunit ribosomal protein L15
MPLQRRIPKRGFTNINRVEYQVVNIRDIARMEPGEVSPEILYAHGLVGKLNQPVKILGTGELESAYQVTAHKFSGSAKAKIEAAGGTVTVMSPESPAGGGFEAEPAEEEPAAEAEVAEEASAPQEGEEASESEEEQA